MTYAAYFRATLLTLAALLAGLALFCGAVDPYGVIGTPVLPGLTARKVAAPRLQRLTKPYRIEAMAPATIIVGTSSTNIGLDPGSPAWLPQFRPVYNLGIDGASAPVQRRFLQHGLARAHPKLVVIATSYEDSTLAPRIARNEGASDMYAFERRMRVAADGTSNPLYWLGRIEDTAFALLSATAVRDSVATLRGQRDPSLDEQTAGGLDTRVRFAEWTARSGAADIIGRGIEAKLKELSESPADALAEAAGTGAMVRDARAAGADVIVMITPQHSAGLELRRRLGQEDAARRWREAMVAAVFEAARATGGAQHVAVMDFSGYGTLAQSPILRPGDKREMPWFWDTTHFKTALGTRMIERVMGQAGAAGFGVALTPETLAAATAADVAAERAWRAGHGDEEAVMGALAAEARAAVCARREPGCKVPIDTSP